MAERKTPNKGYQKLKSDLSAGNIGQVYIFYGEESCANTTSARSKKSSFPRALRSSTTTA